MGFAAAPPAGSRAGTGRLRLLRSGRRVFDRPAEFLQDPEARAHLAGYLTDLTRPYRLTVPPEPFESPDGLGQSYGEMAEALIREVVPADEPVDLLVLAFAMPDMWPGRATATYLSHVCPGTPLSFAICEQGSAAAFTGLRVARDYAASTGCRRALLLVVEQAVLPYPAPGARTADRHQAVALLFGTEPADAGTQPADANPGDDSPAGFELAEVRIRGGVAPAEVAELAASELAALTAELHEPRLLISASLAAALSAADAVAPAGQPITGLWWQLLDEQPGSLLLADYEPDLGYLSLAAFTTG